MKNLIVLLSIIFVGTASASVELIAGWETWVGRNAGEATRLKDVAASYTCSQWSIHSTGGSADGSFGSFLQEPIASVAAENLEDGQRLPNGNEGNHVFTITDTSGTARALTFFHFDSGSLRKKSSRHWKLEVLSGDLSVGLVATGSVPEPAVGGEIEWHNYDVDLRGLKDHVLDANGTVVFRLSFSGGIVGSSGHHQMLDNVGISGNEEKESGTLGLITACGVGLLFIRRRFMR